MCTKFEEHYQFNGKIYNLTRAFNLLSQERQELVKHNYDESVSKFYDGNVEVKNDSLYLCKVRLSREELAAGLDEYIALQPVIHVNPNQPNTSEVASLAESEKLLDDFDALYEEQYIALSRTFKTLFTSLHDFQEGAFSKLRKMNAEQRKSLESTIVTPVLLTNFKTNAEMIRRSNTSLMIHAGNLSHVKPTLLRIEALTMSDDKLAKLLNSASQSCQTEAPSTESILLPFRQQNSDTSTTRHWSEIPDEKSAYPQRASSSNKVDGNTCFVFYLPRSVTQETLRELFAKYGTIKNAHVAMDKVTNRPRGFGYVEFTTCFEAQAAVAALNKHPLDGKFLSVTIKL